MNPQVWAQTLDGLERLSADPRKVTGSDNWFNGFQLLVEYLTIVPPRVQKLTRPLRKYPAPFEKVAFRARDGVRLVGWLGRAAPAGNGSRPDGIVLIPGFYTSKDNARIRARAVRILRHWGFHVLTLDLRGVGESDRVPSTFGWKEAEDIVDAVRYLREAAPVARVHVYAESVAASAAVIAAGMEAQAGRRLTDGRVLAMSAYAHAEKLLELYAAPQPGQTELGRDFVVVQKFFNALLRLNGYKGRFDAYARDAARHYHVTWDEYLRRSSPLHFVADANGPLLIVHSRDDGLVPVSEAEALARRARGNPHVRVWILPWGYHCLYEMADPDWYWRMLETVFEAPTAPAAPAVPRTRAPRPRARA